jgi:hypothetical protein
MKIENILNLCDLSHGISILISSFAISFANIIKLSVFRKSIANSSWIVNIGFLSLLTNFLRNIASNQ